MRNDSTLTLATKRVIHSGTAKVPWLSNVSIRTKLFFTVVLSTSASLLVAGLFFVTYDSIRFMEQQVTDASIQAEMLGSATSAALVFNDEKVAGERLATLKALPQVIAAALYDEKGRVFATYLRASNTNYVPPPVESVTHRLVDDHLLLFHPIQEGKEKIGTVFLHLDTGRTPRIIRYAGAVLILSFSAMLAVLLLSANLQTLIAKPLLEVTEAAKYVVNQQDYSRRVAKRGDDEVGVLVDAFNQMMEQIEQRTVALESANAALQSEMSSHKAARKEVADLNRDLEKRVSERTAELERATRAKSTFLATMSHEIRTPMNGVLGMLELLSLTELDAEQMTTVEIVRESGRSLLRIIDDILDFSRIEAGKLDIRPEIASVGDIVHRVFSIYSGNASTKGLVLKPTVDARISSALWVDPVRLQQILNNFVSNAIKFTSRGEVGVRAELIHQSDQEETVRFTVSDTGIGISSEHQKHLFQPFVQADSGTYRKFGGSGLGLSICRRLAEMLGGAISIDSQPGQGTSVALTLSMPIAEAHALVKTGSSGNSAQLLRAKSRLPAPPIAEAERNHTLVLVVDDHPINTLVIVRQLNTLGYAAETAENGLLALEKWKSGRFTLVLTDCNMPEMSGYELAQAIRTIEVETGLGRTPIIACTANALGEEAAICLEAGMDDYIPKPVNLDSLLRKLDHWLPIARPASEPTAEEPPIDQGVLNAVTGGNAAIENDVFALFRLVIHEDVATFRHAVTTVDKLEVLRASHRIKGAARTVGALYLAEACENIEMASRESDWLAVHALMAKFDHEVARLIQYLQQL